VSLSVIRGGIAAVGLLLAGEAALADDYDNALHCVVLIEIAKQEYTGKNVDALRDAGAKMLTWADTSRPKNLTDKQKLDRYTAAIEKVQKSGGLKAEENRAQAVSCAGYFNIELELPPPK
jgi:hypothetical protein